MGIPASLADLLGRPLHGVARILVRHERRTEFRWLGVIELALVVLACICAIPCLLLWFFAADGAADDGGSDRGFLDFMQARLFRRHHDVVLTFHGPGGAVLAELRQTPERASEADALLGSILACAAREGVVVVETIGAEVADVFYGGRPLLARPEAIDLDALGARLKQAGVETTWLDERVEITLPGGEASRFGAIALLVIASPLIPVLAVFSRGRTMLRHLLLNVRGEQLATTRLIVRPQRLELVTTRAGEVLSSDTFDIADLLCVSFAPSLGYEGEIRRYAPRLILRTQRSARTLPVEIDGDALRALLVGAILQLRMCTPGLPGLTADATRCPYCATLYRLEPGGRCPSCGAYATALA